MSSVACKNLTHSLWISLCLRGMHFLYGVSKQTTFFFDLQTFSSAQERCHAARIKSFYVGSILAGVFFFGYAEIRNNGSSENFDDTWNFRCNVQNKKMCRSENESSEHLGGTWNFRSTGCCDSTFCFPRGWVNGLSLVVSKNN